MSNDASDKPDPKGKKGPRKVRVDFRKNRGKLSRNNKEWDRLYREGDQRHEDVTSSESVRAKGDLSRKRTIIVNDESEAALKRGTVVRVRGLLAEVDENGRLWACTVRQVLRKRLSQERHPITVGDRVGFAPVESAGAVSQQVSDDQILPEGVIDAVEPRTTTLIRHYERKLQAIAANVDNVIIVVAAANPTLRPHLVDRYIVAVHQGEMRPVICINKSDLDETGEAAALVEEYRRIGYTSILTSVKNGVGIEAMIDVLRDQTSVLVGPSGVGKSSLLNAIDPELRLKVGGLSDLERGRHTTTTASLIRWRFGGYVVDTPGMRQFDIAEIESSELEAFFIEFRDRVRDCKFPNCSHTIEENCAIRAAVESGDIDEQRHDSYVRMYEECREKERDRYT